MKNKLLFRYYLIISCLYASGLGIWTGTIYLYMKHVHYTYGQINLFLVIFWIVSFFTEIPMGMLADKYGQLKIGMTSCLVRSLGLVTIAVSNLSIIYLVLGACLTAIGQSLYSGSLDSWIVNKVKGTSIDLDSIFAKKNTVVAITTMVSGYIGSQYLGNINLQYPLIAGALLLVLPIPFLLYLDHKLKDFCEDISTKRKQLITSIKNINLNKEIIVYFLMLLSVLFVTTNPYNQWQLFFQKQGQHIQTGYILVAINLVSILGAYLMNFIKVKNKIHLFSSQILILTVFLIASVMFKSKQELISIIFFLVHTLITSSSEVTQYSLLQTKITSNKTRTTVTSVYNCMESLISVIAVGINGFVSNKLGIGAGWIIFGIFGVILFIAFNHWNHRLGEVKYNEK